MITRLPILNAPLFLLSCLLLWGTLASAEASPRSSLKIGWAETDITPEGPAQLTGLGRAVRVTDEVKDPLTATVLVLESTEGETPVRTALVSLDLLSASECIRDGVRQRVTRDLPELPPEAIVFFATHTHTAPFHYTRPRYQPDFVQSDKPWIFRRDHHRPMLQAIAEGEVPEPVTCREYVGLVVDRVSEALTEAWETRTPGGIAFGEGKADIGYNRVMRDQGIENDHLMFMGAYDADGNLSGVMLNLPAPVQSQTSGRRISADFMHETRRELRERFGEDLYVLAQITAAGDQHPRSNRQANAERIADAVESAWPAMRKAIDWTPVLHHHVQMLELPRREFHDEDDRLAIEVHALRLGHAGMVTNPFELFLDYGLEIRERSPADWTFVVQLAGPGSYLPTERAVEHGGYGATRGSREIGPQGGAELVDWSVQTLSSLWE